MTTAQRAKNPGMLASQAGRPDLELQVLESAAGFYIGTFSENGPYTRESQEYFLTRSRAEGALDQGTWNQRAYL